MQEEASFHCGCHLQFTHQFVVSSLFCAYRDVCLRKQQLRQNLTSDCTLGTCHSMT